MRRLRCAYLTMDNIADFVTDADLSFGPMDDLGWNVEMVSWRSPPADWDDYDAVYICTPWDYPQDSDAFLSVLETIDRSRALLVNSLSLVNWNLAKTYLRELESRGADIVPSSWYENFGAANTTSFFDEHGTDRVVIKPVVGANAADTWVLNKAIPDSLETELRNTFAERPFLVQPFIANIQSEGEYSLFFFAGEYSHAIRKTPKPGDFRVQEEHGANIQAAEPPPGLVRLASGIIDLVEPQPVYVRADFVRSDADKYLLMELELIEPSLYLRTDPDAAQRFAAAFDAHVRLEFGRVDQLSVEP